MKLSVVIIGLSFFTIITSYTQSLPGAGLGGFQTKTTRAGDRSLDPVPSEDSPNYKFSTPEVKDDTYFELFIKDYSYLLDI